MKDSRLEGFYKKPIFERLKLLQDFADLSGEELQLLEKQSSLPLEQADKMIENVVGTYPLPFAVATNFKINGRPYLIPMVLEEPSVVAAASNAAKLALPEGFTASSTDPVMIGQIQLVGIKEKEFDAVKKKILAAKKKLLEKANAKDSTLVKFGGGAKDIEVHSVKTPRGMHVVVHLLVDCRDAMGANAVNTFCEALAPDLEELTGGKARLRILTNLAIYRIAKATATWKKEDLGDAIIDAILDSYALAASDQFRATTHNKGIMNGIDAVVLATGNDFRAVEAGAHSYASYKRGYTSLTHYEKDNKGNLVGTIELPLAVGLIGGATRTHPIAKIAVKILNVKTAQELSQVIAAVGLAQNFAALRALSGEGINRGHMELHARNIAISAGATGAQVDEIAAQMVTEKNVRADRAKELLEGMQKKRKK